MSGGSHIPVFNIYIFLSILDKKIEMKIFFYPPLNSKSLLILWVVIMTDKHMCNLIVKNYNYNGQKQPLEKKNV